MKKMIYVRGAWGSMSKINIMDLEQIGIGLLIFSIGWLILSIWMMVWAYKRKGLVGFLLAFFLNWLGLDNCSLHA